MYNEKQGFWNHVDCGLGFGIYSLGFAGWTSFRKTQARNLGNSSVLENRSRESYERVLSLSRDAGPENAYRGPSTQ